MLAVRDHVPGLRALLADWTSLTTSGWPTCSPADVLTVRLFADSHLVEISARVAAAGEPVLSALSLQVLQTLADSLDCWIEDTGDVRMFRLDVARTAPSVTSVF